MLGPRQQILRMSCNGVEIRLRINPDNAWIVIHRPGEESFYKDIAADALPHVLRQYHAIGKDPERFEAFVNRLLRLRDFAWMPDLQSGKD